MICGPLRQKWVTGSDVPQKLIITGHGDGRRDWRHSTSCHKDTVADICIYIYIYIYMCVGSYKHRLTHTYTHVTAFQTKPFNHRRLVADPCLANQSSHASLYMHTGNIPEESTIHVEWSTIPSNTRHVESAISSLRLSGDLPTLSSDFRNSWSAGCSRWLLYASGNHAPQHGSSQRRTPYPHESHYLQARGVCVLPAYTTGRLLEAYKKTKMV